MTDERNKSEERMARVEWIMREIPMRTYGERNYMGRDLEGMYANNPFIDEGYMRLIGACSRWRTGRDMAEAGDTITVILPLNEPDRPPRKPPGLLANLKLDFKKHLGRIAEKATGRAEGQLSYQHAAISTDQGVVSIQTISSLVPQSLLYLEGAALPLRMRSAAEKFWQREAAEEASILGNSTNDNPFWDVSNMRGLTPLRRSGSDDGISIRVKNKGKHGEYFMVEDMAACPAMHFKQIVWLPVINIDIEAATEQSILVKVTCPRVMILCRSDKLQCGCWKTSEAGNNVVRTVLEVLGALGSSVARDMVNLLGTPHRSGCRQGADDDTNDADQDDVIRHYLAFRRYAEIPETHADLGTKDIGAPSSIVGDAKCDHAGRACALGHRTVMCTVDDGVVTMNKAEQYVAVSYVWGQFKSFDQKADLTVSLAAHYGEEIWADWVTIDQKCANHKLEQIKTMGDKYRMAKKVVIMMPEIEGVFPDMKPGDEATVGEAEREHLANLSREVAASPWFTRAWTWQEGRWGADFEIWTGRQTINGYGFRAMASSGWQRPGKHSAVHGLPGVSGRIPLNSHVDVDGLKMQMPSIMPAEVKEYSAWWGRTDRLSLQDALSATANRVAGTSRDHIMAVSSSLQRPMSLTYEQTAESIWEEAVRTGNFTKAMLSAPGSEKQGKCWMPRGTQLPVLHQVDGQRLYGDSSLRLSAMGLAGNFTITHIPITRETVSGGDMIWEFRGGGHMRVEVTEYMPHEDVERWPVLLTQLKDRCVSGMLVTEKGNMLHKIGSFVAREMVDGAGFKWDESELVLGLNVQPTKFESEY